MIKLALFSDAFYDANKSKRKDEMYEKSGLMPARKLVYVLFLITTLSFLQSCKKPPAELTATLRHQYTETPIIASLLTSDSRHAIILDAKQQLTIWDNDSLNVIRQWSPESLPENSQYLAYSASKERLLVASDKIISVWNYLTGTLVGTLDLTPHLGDAEIESLLFTNNTSKFVIGTSSGSIIFADIGNNTFRQNQAHSGEVRLLRLSKNGQTLYSGGNDGKVVQWDLFNLKVKESIETPFRITSLVLSSESNKVFVSDALDEQFVWDPTQNRVVFELDYWQQYRWFRHGIFINNNEYLLTSSPKTELFLWDLVNNQEILYWYAESHSMGSTVSDMALTPDNQLLTLTSDGVLQKWDYQALLRAEAN